EDYPVTIIPPGAGSGIYATKSAISTTADGARAVSSADLDGDGDTDVLSASSYDHKFAWYENDGNEHFRAHTITNNAPGARSASAVDLDSDGDLDVLGVATDAFNSIIWYENDGSQNFTGHSITAFQRANVLSAVAADIDQDGDIDVATGAEHTNTAVWYENDGSQHFSSHVMGTLNWDDLSPYSLSVSAADLDRDGDLDVLYNLAADYIPRSSDETL